MPKVVPGKVQFMACTISRSACTTKELPLQVCARAKNHMRERMAENYAREMKRKCEFAKYRTCIAKSMICIDSMLVAQFLNPIKYFTMLMLYDRLAMSY